MTLGELHNPKKPPEEGNGKPLLGILYLENPEKRHHMSGERMNMCGERQMQLHIQTSFRLGQDIHT